MAVTILAVFLIGLLRADAQYCPAPGYLVNGNSPIPDSYLTCSSEWSPGAKPYDTHGPERARLDYKAEIINGMYLRGSWSAETNDANQWIQAQFLDRSFVTGVVTQGRNVYSGDGCCPQYFTSYKIHYSDDCVNFVTIQDSSGQPVIFPGNTDQDSHKTNQLPTPVFARCVRIQVVSWQQHVSLRFDVLGCQCGQQCPVNGGYSTWSSWGACSVTCASGESLRTRSCNNPSPVYGGTDCSSLGSSTETQPCNTGITCPINGGYTAWSSWGTCSVTCASGTWTRSRSCTNPAPQHKGADCTSLGAATETTSCNTGIMCPINGGYTTWSSWGTCSVTCASGTWTRSRSCTNPAPQHKGADCTSLGAATETTTCNTGIMCPINGGYTAWSSWGTCSVTCASGTWTRSRSCTNPAPQYNGADCTSLGAATTTSTCDSGIMCPINGGYTAWSSWGTCSVTCASGTWTRSRSCTNPAPQHKGADCTSLGAATEATACNTGIMCPINGGYTSWSSWGTCSVTCASGIWTRSRSCSNPAPQHKGADCTSLGAATETSSCNTGIMCPINGGYTSWSAWGMCSVTCEDGTKIRSRSCTNPAPQHNGANCNSLGAASETSSCNAGIMCPIDGGYTSWTMWSACSVTCEKGSMSRSRTCSNPTPLHNGANCDKFGANNEEEACDAGIMCPIDGGYADWSGWSKCSAECGSGFINRTRTCTNPEPQYDGASCAVIGSPDDSEVCDTGVPCKVDGTWGKWQAWSVCSKTCGGGKSQRVRYCDNPAPKGGGAPCFGSAMETKTCSSEKCPIDPNANAYSVQKCPNGFFACKTGSITCIEDLFVCDCAEDCADGSDESKTWAQCPTTCKSNAKALKATIGTLAVMMAIINLLHI